MDLVTTRQPIYLMECLYHLPAAAKPVIPDLIRYLQCHRSSCATPALLTRPLSSSPFDAAVHGASTLAGLHPRAPLYDSYDAAPAVMLLDAAAIMLCTDCCHVPAAIDYYTG
jgi:hypothetical protein